MSLAVDPVGSDDLKTFLLQLITLLFIPVGFDQSPALIPVIKQERSEYNTEIRYAVVCIESAVCQCADILSCLLYTSDAADE